MKIGQDQKKFYTHPEDDEEVFFILMQKALDRNKYCGNFETQVLSTYNRFVLFGSMAVKDFKKGITHSRLCRHQDVINSNDIPAHIR